MDSTAGGDLAQLADNYLKIQLTPTKGITGSISITSGLTNTQITNLVSRISTVQSFTGGTTVVINWGSSGLVYAADRAQLGRDISGMISEAHGRLGRGA